MDDDGSAASIILFVVLLLLDVFFNGFEAAVRLLSDKEMERRADEGKDQKAVKLLKIIASSADYTGVVQLFTTLVNMMMGAAYFGILFRLIQRGLLSIAQNRIGLEGAGAWISPVSAVLSALTLLYIILVFGVLLPARAAAGAPEKWAYACVDSFYFAMKALWPILWPAVVAVRGLLKLFGAAGGDGGADVTEAEIIHMVNEGHEQGVIQASEAKMISNIFELGDKEAQDIMTHRNHVVGIEAGMTLGGAIAFMLAGINSRYPVYDENIDHIIGILHLKDALRFRGAGEKQDIPLKELDGLLREPCFVPRTKNIDELFREMQAKKLQMVVVVDEYGQTDGLLAMEDILEEIVGSILDEYDEESRYIEERENDEYVIAGITPLKEIEEHFGLSFEHETVETLNGFLISRMERLPEPDEKFGVDYCGYHFEVFSVENKVIQSVLVTKL